MVVSLRAGSSRLLLLLPALFLSGLAAFVAGWIVARGTAEGQLVGAALHCFLLLCGVSGVAWSLPQALNARQRCPTRARSPFWRYARRAALLRFVGGGCVGTGLFVVVWRLAGLPAPLGLWSWPIILASLAIGGALWHLGAKELANAPSAARAAVREARAFLRRRVHPRKRALTESRS